MIRSAPVLDTPGAAADRFAGLPPYAFPRLRALLGDTPPGLEPINLSIGEPKHAFPPFVAEALTRHQADYGRYPPNQGTESWQAAVAGWLTRRFNLPQGQIGEKHLVPLNGTREGLFQAAIALVPPHKAGAQPAVLMPNPFYQCYAGAALAAGAEPVFLNAGKDTGFLPDLDAIPAQTWDRAALFYLCSPANPQGAVASRAYLEKLIGLTRAHDCVLALDECYSEIYTGTAPAGGLDVAWSTSGSFAGVLVFHSLSKRSNLPGLRSGFAAGDPELASRFMKVRAYGGAPSPIPVYEAAALAWGDEAHVEQNRAAYAEKFALADQMLGDRFGPVAPQGGFFLWLDVGGGEKAAFELWRDQGLRVLPGGYLAREDQHGINPGAAYIRVALVDDPGTLADAFGRLNIWLDTTNGTN